MKCFLSSPTSIPTTSPTNDCLHLLVGSACEYGTNLDILLVVDESSSVQDYNEFREALADSILSEFSATNSRIAVLKFATVPEVLTTFGPSNEEVSTMIRYMRQLGGGSWTRNALIEAFDTIWTPVLSDRNRNRLTVIISDGSPSTNQEPCDIISMYSF